MYGKPLIRQYARLPPAPHRRLHRKRIQLHRPPGPLKSPLLHQQRCRLLHPSRPDPVHSFPDTNFQLYGTKNYPHDNSSTPNVSGFANSFSRIGGNPTLLMNAYRADQVPVISTLAQEFKVCNRWFSSVPGPTDPNKFFLHAAQTQGQNSNCPYIFCEGYPLNVTTIFENMVPWTKTELAIKYISWIGMKP